MEKYKVSTAAFNRNPVTRQVHWINDVLPYKQLSIFEKIPKDLTLNLSILKMYLEDWSGEVAQDMLVHFYFLIL